MPVAERDHVLAAMRRSALPFVHSWTVAALNAVPGPVARGIRTNRVLSRMLAPIVNRLVPEGLTQVVIRSGPARGLQIVIEPKEEKFYWAGTHELEVQRKVVEALAPGSVFWDVGAHCGFFSCLAARQVGVDGSVVAFEPVPQNRERLLAAVHANRLENVAVRPAAVGADSGTVALHARGENSTMWTLAADESSGRDLIVTSTTLDEELERAARPPDVIKIDVEGAENDVLAGAARLLAEHRPVVLVEFHGDELLEAARALLPASYELTRLEGRQWVAAPHDRAA